MTTTQLEADRVADIRFCFACGTPCDTTECACGAPIEPLEWEATAVGSVYRLKGLRSKTGVVVSAGDKLTLVTGRGKTIEVSQRKLDRSDCVLDMSRVPSEFYRLKSIADRAEEWAQGIAHWLEQPTVQESWLSGWTSRRLYARSAVAAGRTDLVQESELPSAEIAWLEMHAAFAMGATARSVQSALALPAEGFPDKAFVVLSAVVNGAWRPSDQEAKQIDSWPHVSIEATALRAAIGLELGLEEWEQVMEWLPTLSSLEDRHWMELMIAGDPGQALSDRDQGSIERVVSGGRQTSLAERVVAARFGTHLALDSQEVAVLASNALSVLDDLIDQGHLGLLGASDELNPEVRGRVAPGDLSIADLQALGHNWELARRNYLTDGPSDWPEGFAGDHYRSLLALKSGDTSALGLIRDETGVALAVASAITSGSIESKALSDPTAWEVLDRHVDLSAGLGDSAEAGAWSLRKAIQALLDWDWESAGDNAIQALKTSSEEVVRDEALNIIAFLRYQSQEDESAVTALERALDGDYTSALQANAGIVAEHLAPEKAAYHLGRLASEAPTTDLKLAAVRRAFRIWNASRLAWDKDGDLPTTPEELLTAVRELATSDIEIDDFAEVMRLIANFDEDWLANESNTASSPHNDSWERRVYVAKSGGDPEDYIEAVAAGLRSGYDADWLVSERDSMVDGLRALIFEDIEHLGPATYAFIAIDKELPMSDWNRVVLSCGALVSICRSLVSQDGLPSDQVVQMFDDAKRSVQDLEPEEQDQVADLIDMAGNSLAHAIAAGREELLRQGYQALGNMFSQLEGVPIWRIDWTKVAEAFQPVRNMADESIRELNKAKDYASADPLAEAIDKVLEGFRELRGFAANPRSAF